MPKKANRAVSFSFRPYNPSDNPYLVKLVREQMQPILEQAMGEPYQPEEFLYHVISSQTRILESNGQPIGFFTYLPLPEEGRMLFSSMILEKEFQGRGIGKKIFEYVESEAFRLRCPEVECEVQRGNDRALKLYRELGYQEVEIPWENTIRLRKLITEDPLDSAHNQEPSSQPESAPRKTPVAAAVSASTSKPQPRNAARSGKRPSHSGKRPTKGAGVKSFL